VRAQQCHPGAVCCSRGGRGNTARRRRQRRWRRDNTINCHSQTAAFCTVLGTLINAVPPVRLKSSVLHLLAGGVFAAYDIILLILNFQLGEATPAAISRYRME